MKKSRMKMYAISGSNLWKIEKLLSGIVKITVLAIILFSLYNQFINNK